MQNQTQEYTVIYPEELDQEKKQKIRKLLLDGKAVEKKAGNLTYYLVKSVEKHSP